MLSLLFDNIEYSKQFMCLIQIFINDHEQCMLVTSGVHL
jgi:hypothetical protein